MDREAKRRRYDGHECVQTRLLISFEELAIPIYTS